MPVCLNPTLVVKKLPNVEKNSTTRIFAGLVEITENIGKIISINIETGEYEIGDDLIVTSRRLREKQADAVIWSERIGFNAVFALSGTLVRRDV